MTHLHVAENLFAAFAAGRADAVRALCTTDFTGQQNGGAPMTLGALLGFALAVKQVVPDLHYANIVRGATASGFVEEHDVCGSLPDGTPLALPVWVVADVVDGQVQQLREYFDTAAAAGLIAALNGG